MLGYKICFFGVVVSKGMVEWNVLEVLIVINDVGRGGFERDFGSRTWHL